MAIFTLLVIILTLPFTLVRLTRWLAWSQQKEYRIDRLWQFLISEEGVSELLRVIPTAHDFTRSGLKRPALTLRAGLVGFVSLTLIGFLLTASYNYHWWWLPIAIYLLVPIFPGLISLLTEIAKSLLSMILLFLAKQKLARTNPKILGITGSYGKTTTRHLTTHLISQEFKVFTPPKSHNTPISIAWSILKNYQGEEIVFLEFAAYKKGEIAKLAKWFPPEISLVTGVTEQHLALFGSVENIIKAKGELAKATLLSGAIFYNGNDPNARRICEQDPSKKSIPYSGPESTVILANTKLDHKGRLRFTWQGREIQTHLVGLHCAETVQAAIRVAQALDVPENKIREGLKSFLPTSNFIQIYQHAKLHFWIINDGKTSNPQGFIAGLAVLKHFKNNGKNTLLLTSGIIDLGELSDEIHLRLAKASLPIADLVLYTGIDGQHVFREIFGNRLTIKETNMQTVINKLNESDVMLIEGNIPLWLMKQLKHTP